MADLLNLDLQPASFRGVPFHVDGAGVEAGRRVQVHEYPQRDKPWAEDLGRATRGFTVDAFVTGADYIEQARSLIAAAEEEGPGTLVHPWLGSMQVSLKDLVRVRFDAALGHAVIGFSFVEPGELEFPSAADSTPAQSRIAADTMCAAAGESFAGSFGTEGLPAFVGEAAGLDLSRAIGFAATLGGHLGLLTGLAGQLGSVSGVASLLGLGGSFGLLRGWAGQLGGWLGVAKALLGVPQALAQSVLDMFDLSGLVASASGADAGVPVFGAGTTTATAVPAGLRASDPLAAVVLGIARLAGTGGAGGAFPAPVVPAGATPARQRQVANTAALNALVRRALLAQAVGISSHIDATVQADVHAVRDQLCAALDAESLAADDASYTALQTARRAVWADLTTRSNSGARLLDLMPTELQPALLIAYDRYEDADRADEIVLRNRLAHPGFVPVRALQVLSR